MRRFALAATAAVALASFSIPSSARANGADFAAGAAVGGVIGAIVGLATANNNHRPYGYRQPVYVQPPVGYYGYQQPPAQYYVPPRKRYYRYGY